MADSIGVIDVGTNSVLALGITRSGSILYNDYTISEFGKGLVNNNLRLSAEAIQRTLLIVSDFVTALKKCGIKTIKVTGTSASRDAQNIQTFIDAIWQEHNIRYEVISGEAEANFTYLGALSLFPELPSNNVVMMDIGGGSTEVIIGCGTEISFKHSFQMGSVRLKDQLNCDYCFTAEDQKRLRTQILQLLNEVPVNAKEMPFVGIGGTFTTITAIDLKLRSYQPERVNGHQLSLDRLYDIFAELNAMNEMQRTAVVGLETKRAPLILYGLMIFIVFMEMHTINAVTTTDYGLRFGVANKFFQDF